jgi:hypothetical protein
MFDEIDDTMDYDDTHRYASVASDDLEVMQALRSIAPRVHGEIVSAADPTFL